MSLVAHILSAEVGAGNGMAADARATTIMMITTIITRVRGGTG
ncbi:hypothetical protein [Sphingosinicella sp. CPCC 101087]|nr:hypothetical protein [Sphingosinicella sp. CPCC 101087]